LDKGFSYTIKELVTRPIYSIIEYIEGKRVDHFNYFIAFLLILALGHFIGPYSLISSVDLFINGKMSGFSKVSKEFTKFIILVAVLFFALASYTLFRKAKLNYIESSDYYIFI
jgi:hypothetical protein